MTATGLPRWTRRTVYLGGGVLFAAGAFLSGWSLTLLAEQCGIPRPFSLSLPLALDAGAAVGVALWVSGTGEVQRSGRNTARLLFALSVIGNAIERIHAYERWSAAPLVVAVGVAVVFPLLAYRMAHLVLLVRRTQDAPSRAKPAPKAKAPAKRDTAPPSKAKPAAKRSGGDAEEQVTVDGVTFWAVRIPDDASDAERDRIGAANRTRKARAKKAQMNGVAA